MRLDVDSQGLHPTTTSCLEAMAWLQGKRGFSRILDVGCGNGILSLTAAGIWNAQVIAADIAQVAVSDTARHSHEHGMESLITPIRSDGFQHPLIRERAPYDLILFNLLAEPIVQMSPHVKSHLAPGGICILSGILEWLSSDVEAAYTALSFGIMHSILRSPWQTYIMRMENHADAK